MLDKEEISTLDYWERMNLQKGDSFYKLSIPDRVSIDELYQNNVRNEMINEIHRMLLELTGRDKNE